MEFDTLKFNSNVLMLDADRNVSLTELVYYSQPSMSVNFTDLVKERIIASRNTLTCMVNDGKIIYGVNTSMGGLLTDSFL